MVKKDISNDVNLVNNVYYTCDVAYDSRGGRSNRFVRKVERQLSIKVGTRPSIKFKKISKETMMLQVIHFF